MGLVNQTIPGLYGGVSQQTPELRHDTQVTEMINCYPTIIGGVAKRPPTSVVYNDDTFPIDSFIYSYDRGAGNEQYIIAISSDAKYRLFDIITNVWINEWTYNKYLVIPAGAKAKDSFALSTVGDTTFVVNKTKICTMNSSSFATNVTDTIIDDTYKVKPVVTITYGGDVENPTTDYTYTIKGYFTINMNITINGVAIAKSFTSEYINDVSSADNSDFYNPTEAIKSCLKQYEVIDINNSANNVNIYGTTINTALSVTINSITASFSGTGSYEGSWSSQQLNVATSWQRTFFYWVSRTGGGSDSVNQPLRYNYYIYKNGTQVATTISHDSTVVASSLASAIGGQAKGSVVRRIADNDTDLWTGADSWGNQASRSWQSKIKKLQDLPNELGFEGSIIEISGDEDTAFDSYYVRYNGGTYEETVKPGLNNYLDEYTMPHKIELRRLDDGTYHNIFSTIDWSPRTVGDELSASEPSFVGQTITDVFFFRNRLGFIAGDNVLLSESGEYYNFFPTTVTSVLDSDPIDVAVDSNQAVTLRYAVPYNKELLIFGDKAQFVMSAKDTLTPKDVSVQQSTAFNIKDIEPVALGPNVYFAVEKNNFSGIREYYVQPDSLSNDAADITAHCPNYIPKNLTKIVGSAKNDMLFALSSETPNTVYVYNFYWQGEEKAQSAWHKWEFDHTDVNIFDIAVIGSNLLLMIERYNVINLEILPLEFRLDFGDINYSDAGYNTYESKIVLTKPGFAAGTIKVDDVRGTFVLKSIKVNADYGSFYNVINYRFNKPRDYYYNNGLGQYPDKTYISSKEYNYKASSGVFPGTSLVPTSTLVPGSVTYSMNSDHKYPVAGNVNNLELVLTNDISSGFRINTLDIVGTYVKNTRNV